MGNAWVSSLCVSLADDVDKVEIPWAWFQCPEQIADSLPAVKLVLASVVVRSCRGFLDHMTSSLFGLSYKTAQK